MALLGSITGFLDKYILGYAIGTAAGPSLEPFVQELANEGWRLNQVLPLDAEIAAGIAAEDVDSYDRMAAEASLTGIDGGRFKDLYGETLNAPGIGELFALWRRGLITDGTFTHGLRKAKLEGLWDGPLEGLRDVLLSSEELAMMQQQGFVDAARADSEGALQGVTAERQQLRFEASGLPPGIAEGLQMLRRGIITEAVFAQIVREGHTKTKYTDELLQLRHVVLSASEYATLNLKGWITDAERDAGGALTGYTPAQMQQLYEAHGRPASPHQMFVGLRRGATIGGSTAGIPADFLTAIRRSDIRPEYGEIIWRASTTYPSAFVLRNLTQAGDITEADAHEILLFQGWDAQLAAKVAAAWAGGGGTTADAHVSKAQTQLWATLHTSYRNDETDAATASATLATLGVSAAAQPQVLALWDAERALRRKQLTPAQVKKAYRGAITNRDTGQPYTRDDALAALIERGYSSAQANEFLDL